MEKIQSFLAYLFTMPESEFHYFWTMIIVGTIALTAGFIFAYTYQKRKNHDFAFKKLFKRTSKVLKGLGITILIFALLRFEQVPFFSIRIWLYLLLLLLLFFTYKYLKLYLKVYPREKNNVDRNRKVKKIEKYSTKKKK